MSSSLYHSQPSWLIPDLLTGLQSDAEPQRSGLAWCAELDKTMLTPGLSGRSEWLSAVINHMGTVDVPIVIATTAPTKTGPNRVTGRFALEKAMFRWALPMPVLMDWHNPLFLSGAPIVVARDGADDAFASMLEAAAEQGGRAVVLKEVTLTQEVISALEGSKAKWATTDTAERAALVCGQSYDDWFAGNFSRKRRKEYRRLYNRLSETGTLVSQSFQAGDDPRPWISDFLELESSGWKGQRGTAMACDPKQRGAVSEALMNLAQSGNLLFWKLALDDKPIAMLFAVRCGDTAGLGKIAYSEDLSSYSPGVLLILEATRDLLAVPGLKLVDSHAIPDHPMINNIWRDRIPIADLVLATPGTSAALFGLICRAEEARQNLRQTAKTLYHRYVKRGAK